jgi:hypothetical protein
MMVPFSVRVSIGLILCLGKSTKISEARYLAKVSSRNILEEKIQARRVHFRRAAKPDFQSHAENKILS